MSNPWTKKNPLMSMWLSGANRVAASARSQATAQLKMSAAQTRKQAAADAVDAWVKPFFAGGKPKKKR